MKKRTLLSIAAAILLQLSIDAQQGCITLAEFDSLLARNAESAYMQRQEKRTDPQGAKDRTMWGTYNQLGTPYLSLLSQKLTVLSAARAPYVLDSFFGSGNPSGKVVFTALTSKDAFAGLRAEIATARENNDISQRMMVSKLNDLEELERTYSFLATPSKLSLIAFQEELDRGGSLTVGLLRTIDKGLYALGIRAVEDSTLKPLAYAGVLFIAVIDECPLTTTVPVQSQERDDSKPGPADTLRTLSLPDTLLKGFAGGILVIGNNNVVTVNNTYNTYNQADSAKSEPEKEKKPLKKSGILIEGLVGLTIPSSLDHSSAAFAYGADLGGVLAFGNSSRPWLAGASVGIRRGRYFSAQDWTTPPVILPNGEVGPFSGYTTIDRVGDVTGWRANIHLSPSFAGPVMLSLGYGQDRYRITETLTENIFNSFTDTWKNGVPYVNELVRKDQVFSVGISVLLTHWLSAGVRGDFTLFEGWTHLAESPSFEKGVYNNRWYFTIGLRF